MKDDTRNWLATRFGIPEEDIIWFNNGNCYDRILVKSQQSADKVTNLVKEEYVNGGYLHGLSLGGQSKYQDTDGNIVYDVMC